MSTTTVIAAATASRFSSVGTWRCKDEKSKGRAMLESWRDRGASKESGEVKHILGNWRARGPEKAQEVDEPGPYGSSMPPECKLQALYKQLKVDTTNFTTWLVESVYPSLESLPPYITLSLKQAKDYSKYDIIVNNIPELARRPRKIPPSMVALLERLIDERSEYTHWMSRKSTDNLSKISHEKHLHYIKVLKEARTILAERM